MSDEDKRGPGLRFPPPLLPLGFIGGAWLLQRWQPLPIAGDTRLLLAGILVMVAALLLALTTLFHFWRAKTHVEPWQPTSAIIQGGVFRFSRNPIYLAFCIATFGAALIIDSWWGLIVIVPLVWLLQMLVIRKEENYLEAKFGHHYLDYRRRVRRWI